MGLIVHIIQVILIVHIVLEVCDSFEYFNSSSARIRGVRGCKRGA
jgi:hypothetical protein